MPIPKNDQPSGGRFLGLGLQVAVGAGLGLWIGTWLDRKFGWSPRGALIGALIGIAGGMYLLIKEALKANKD
jgi:F0F1-type ATP synthase assembly protein I